jgi:VanZ family protein
MPGDQPQWRHGHHHYGWGPQDRSWLGSLQNLGSNYGGQLLVGALITLLAGLVALRLRGRRPWIFGLNPAATALALGSLAVIAVSTLTPRSNTFGEGGIQLVPLHTLRQYAHDPADFLIYVGGNVALFVPLGFFLGLALRRWLLAGTVVCTLVSVSVELLQLPIYTRSTDVDDVLTNATGGFLGAALAAFVLATARRGHLGRWLKGVIAGEPGLDDGEHQHDRDAGQATGDGGHALPARIGHGSDQKIPQPGSPGHDHDEDALEPAPHHVRGGGLQDRGPEDPADGVGRAGQGQGPHRRPQQPPGGAVGTRAW